MVSSSIVKIAFILIAAGQLVAQPATPSDAIAFEQQGKFAEATLVWRKVTAQNPNDAGAFASLGLDLARQGKYVEAVPAYRKALTLDAKLPGVPLDLGLAEFKQGHFEGAIVPLKSALAADRGRS